MIRSNEFHTYFRVNSVFWDPEHLRPLPGAGDRGRRRRALLWARERRDLALLTALVAVLWLGLAPTFSQSSFIALLAGPRGARRAALELALDAGRGRRVGAVGAVARRHLRRRLSKSTPPRINIDTSGRANLVSGGLDLFAERPSRGYGSGSFQARLPRTPREQGRPGLGLPHRAGHGRRRAGPDRPALYVALIVVGAVDDGLGLGGIRRAARRDAARARRPGPRSSPPSSRCSSTRWPTPASSRTRSPGCCWRSAPRWRAAPAVRDPGVGSRRVGIPAPPGDDRRRLHGGERPLEADRGRAAAALHALPDPGRLRRRRGHVRRRSSPPASSSASA